MINKTKILLSDIISNLEIINSYNFKEKEIFSFDFDSRQINSGSIFVAIQGETDNGLNYLESAIQNGAVAVIYDTEIICKKSTITYLKVPDARKSLAILAKLFTKDVQSRVWKVGITGTNGKTSTSYILRRILEKSLCQDISIMGNLEYDLISEKEKNPINNTPNAKKMHLILEKISHNKNNKLIMEVSSHGLAMKRVWGLEYDYAILTNITQDHLDYHKTMMAYKNAKKELFSIHLKKRGVAIINADSDFAEEFIEICSNRKIRTLIYSEKKQGVDLFLNQYKFNDKGLFCKFIYQGKQYKIQTPLVGSFQRHNIALAILVALDMNISWESIQKSLDDSILIPGRMDSVKCLKCLAVVDYAHTPDALENALKSLKESVGNKKVILVFGCGGNRDNSKRPLMAKIAEKFADYSIVTDDNPRYEDSTTIINEIITGFCDRNSYLIVKDRKKAIQIALNLPFKNYAVLIAGKGHENYQDIKGVKYPFSDKKIIEEYQQGGF